MKVVAIRPEPGLSATVEAGRALGLEITPLPMFGIESCDWVSPGPLGFDGLLLGSANAVRHAGTQLENLVSLPVFAVGRTTAAEAERAGFAVRHIGSGGLQELLDGLDSTPRHLLRLAGEAHVPLDPPAHIQLTIRIVYRSQAIEISSDEVTTIEDALVLLHSAAAAEHFAGQCDRLGLDRKRVALAALGSRIAAAAGGGWQEVGIADHPNDSALLALARDMCH